MCSIASKIFILGATLSSSRTDTYVSNSPTLCAIPVVSELLNEQYGDQAAKCLKVEIIEQVTDKHYKAVATLSNGEDMNIMIEDRGDQIYVTIPLE